MLEEKSLESLAHAVTRHASTEWFSNSLEADYTVFEECIQSPNMDTQNFGTLLAGEEEIVI